VRLALWSLALAVLGLAASRWGAAAVARRGPAAGSRAAWLAGLPALLPAWLLAFVALLGGAGAAGGPPRTAFLGASAAAILGVLASDWLLVREERRPGGARPLACWLIGTAALGPGWLAALLLATRLAP
jgi:hypothetical protein